MTDALIKYEHSTFHYFHAGTGNKNILCLHGYGESAASFKFLTDNLPYGFCLTAIDLPFHGTTQWNEERAFTTTDLVHILNSIFIRLNIEQKALMVLGYSMGARLALNLLQHVPERISRLVLLAPDGINMNFWYRLATQTKAGNRIFRFTMKNPGWFLALLKSIKQLRLANKTLVKLTSNYLNDEHRREQLYQRWTCMRTIKPDIKKIRTIISDRQIPVRIAFGQHDPVILAKKAHSFCKGMDALCHIQIIDTGHAVLQSRFAGVIIKMLTS
jgi:pimeloyl-ACP methyl ester carboxylesterase